MNIYESILEYNSKDIYPFHMPGHKRNTSFFENNLLDFDITEIPGMDNLHNPKGMIHDAQIRAAKIFGADRSFFLVNGSTAGILSAMMATVKHGDTVLMARNCHRSVYNGLRLSGAKPSFIMPGIDEYGIFGGISPGVVRKKLECDDNISVIIITSPTYEGVVSDIESIAEIAHEKNKILIVDGAHGAHFRFSDYFSKSAVECGADIVIQSLHKTLPVLSQTAVLHVNGKKIDIDKLKAELSAIQTSSPSYIMLAQADRCIDMLSKDKSVFESYTGLLDKFRTSVSSIEHIRLLDKNVIGKNSIFDIDLGKLTFLIDSDFNGKKLEEDLRLKYKLQVELSGIRHIIAMTSPADTPEGFERLYEGISEISKKIKPAKPSFYYIKPEIPEFVFTQNELESRHMERLTVNFKKSIDKIAASFIIPYPPGSPIVMPGERINENIISQIELCMKNDIELIGQDNILKEFIDVFDDREARMTEEKNDYFIKILNNINNILIYKNVRYNTVMNKLIEYINSMINDGEEKSYALRSEFFASLIERAEKLCLEGDIYKKFIVSLFLYDENIYSLYCEKNAAEDTSLKKIVLKDLEAFIDLRDTDIGLLMRDEEITGIIKNYKPLRQSGLNNNFKKYIDIITTMSGTAELADTFALCYNSFGCGDLGQYPMFRYLSDKRIEPVENSDKISLEEIIGYEYQKDALIKNTEAFISRYPHNNALLAGARGTGKSSVIKAVVNKYFEKGLRLLEISKDQLMELPDILDILKNRGKFFIIFLDDLSFDDFEVQYKYLKSLLEGGAEARPKNIVFYATSNRRHIIQEKWADKDGSSISGGEIHASDTINEKLSLSDRFGLSIVFQKPSPAEYLEIVEGIAKNEGLELSRDFLTSEAVKWELNQKGLSGRTARQYINALLWDTRKR